MVTLKEYYNTKEYYFTKTEKDFTAFVSASGKSLK